MNKMKNVVCVAVFLFGLLQSAAASEVTVRCNDYNSAECDCENYTRLEYNDTLKFDVKDADWVTSLHIGKKLRMTHIPNNIFTTFRNLRELLIMHNFIVLQNDSFREAYTLKHLYLGHNNITTIPDNAFDGTVNLETIDLSFNTIHDIGHAFRNNTKLRDLYLQSNLIETIKEGSLNLPNLAFLDLEGNKLKTIDALMNGLPKLKYIILRDNKISHIGNTFTVKNKLEYVGLSENPIEDINLTEFSHLESLTFLDISKTGYKLPNEIQSNPTSVSKLVKLNLEHNNLSNPDIFKYLAIFPRLWYLYVKHNDFTSFNDIDRIRDYIPEIKVVDVSANSILCDCIKNKANISESIFVGCEASLG